MPVKGVIYLQAAAQTRLAPDAVIAARNRRREQALTQDVH